MGHVSALDPTGEKNLVVADDGSIPAGQLASLGLLPGARPRVVATDDPSAATPSVAGSLPDLPDLDWDDFERAGDLAQRDLADSS